MMVGILISIKALICFLAIKGAVGIVTTHNQSGCYNSDVILTCPHYTPNKPGTLIWRFKDKTADRWSQVATIRNGQSKLTSVNTALDGRSVIHPNGSLEIHSVRPDDETMYQCIVRQGYRKLHVVNLDVSCGKVTVIKREVCIEEDVVLDCDAWHRTNPRKLHQVKWHQKNTSGNDASWSLLVASIGSNRTVGDGFKRRYSHRVCDQAQHCLQKLNSVTIQKLQKVRGSIETKAETYLDIFELNTANRSAKMRVPKRLPMRLWIKEKLDNCEYPGMKWIDQKEGKFEVSWTHGSRQNWSKERDLKVFMEWAAYTGKFKPGEQRVDGELAKRWKTNFRCALNSLPEIELIREESEGRGARARKVYRMKHDKVTKTKTRKIKETRKQLKTDLEPMDRQIIEIVDQMEDDFSWTPLVIKHTTEQAELDGMAQIRDLLQKGHLHQPYLGWHASTLVEAC